MRRVLMILTLPLCWCTTACNAVSSYAHDVFSKHAFADPPIPTVARFNDLRRRDLLAGSMPPQAVPTQQATRPRADQRPWLQRFLLPRNTIAFA